MRQRQDGNTLVRRLLAKLNSVSQKLHAQELFETEDADTVIVAAGSICSARAAVKEPEQRYKAWSGKTSHYLAISN